MAAPPAGDSPASRASGPASRPARHAHQAELRFQAASLAAASAVARAVAVEALDGPGGSALAWHAEGPVVVCLVTAGDAGSLRAAVTGATRLADAALRVAT